MRYAILLAIGILPLLAGTVQAQRGYWYRNDNNKAATVGESRARGLSDITRARGQYQIDRSQARINDAQARSAEMDNRMQYTNDYFQRREINRQARFGDYAKKKEINSQNRLFRYGQEGRPTRLTSRELDPITGQITWPIVLEAPNFKPYVTPIETAFVQRAESHSRFTYDVYKRVTKKCEELKGELKKRIRDMEPQDWTAAENFVKRLSAEARYAAS